jgi:outer membrane lipoprotein carrier protein
MLRLLLCATLALAWPASGAAAPDANAIRRGIESRYRGALTLKATFYERYSSGQGGGLAESGTVYFSRPGRMRWEYESPEPKLFLVDGANAWFYVPADHTASRAKIKQSSDWRTPIALLAGKADLGELCRSLEIVYSPASPGDARSADSPALQPLAPDDTILRCVPRGSSSPSDDDSSPREILLETDPAYYLTRVLIRQPGDLITEFRFGHWQRDVPIPEIKFHFQPPPGVAVVDEQSLANSLK